MIVLEESPWYQEIVKRGEQRAQVRTLLRILEQRFGAVSPALASELATLEISTLEMLTPMVVTATSLEEFLQAVAQYTAPEPSDNAE